MNRRIVVAVAFSVFLAASAYAQAKDFFALVSSGTPLEVQSAINRGADVKAKDKAGAAPLFYAARDNPNPEVITALLKAGANVNDKDKGGQTALFAAVGGNTNPEIVTILLKAGADAKVKDVSGAIALNYAKYNMLHLSPFTDAYKQLEAASK
jgi:ankyrin repeat protein